MLAVEKPILSKLLKPSNNRRIVNVDLHAGMVGTGLVPDCRQLANRAREEAFSHRETYDCNIPGPALVDRVSLYLQAYTLYSSVRPFGCISILGAVDRDGPHLYMMEPSGLYWGYRACAAGKGRQLARSELEKLDLDTMTTSQAVKEAARMYPICYYSLANSVVSSCLMMRLRIRNSNWRLAGLGQKVATSINWYLRKLLMPPSKTPSSLSLPGWSLNNALA